MTDWPVNYAEQYLVVDRLLAQLETIEKAAKPIVLHRIRQPSRTDWEIAFVRKTRKPLPIPPGSRLFWVNPLSGLTTAFTTAYDLPNGDSSGEIYESVSSVYETGALRLLGSVRTIGGLRSVNEPDTFNGLTTKSTSLAIMMPLDVIAETKKGLLSLLLIGGVHTDMDVVYESKGAQEETDNWWDFKYAANSFNTQQNGATIQAATLGPAATLAPAANTLAEQTAFFAHIDGVALREVGDQMQALSSGIVLMSIFADGETGVGMFSRMRVNPVPLFNGISDGYGYPNPALEGKTHTLWMYGLYLNNEVPAGVHL